mmetsp:Transcript_101548/g.286374  ORF Transcript_101548/g.286374 Transcript_101548/m.286374 type:complete len:303 (+) Transcript_101548:127-1035(+)
MAWMGLSLLLALALSDVVFAGPSRQAAAGESLRDRVVALAEDADAADLDASIAALLKLRRRASTAQSPTPLPPVLYVHKHAFETADPDAAADFVVKHLGGIMEPFNNHTCPASYGPVPGEPAITSLRLQGSSLVYHFVYNPLKAPGARRNATEFGKAVDAMRGDRWAAKGGSYGPGRFDQFMDNHIGMAVASLDPYVQSWQAAGVPFICRTWCCAPGMPQWPDRCPAYSYNRTSGCEVGCYVEIPYGIMIELQCGFTSEMSDGDYNASLACLTHVQPEVFDLCLDERDEREHTFDGPSDLQI